MRYWIAAFVLMATPAWADFCASLGPDVEDWEQEQSFYAILDALPEGDADRVFSIRADCASGTALYWRDGLGDVIINLADLDGGIRMPSRNGRTWEVRRSTPGRFGSLVYDVLDVRLSEGETQIARLNVPSFFIYDTRKRGCFSRPGEGEMEQGVLDVEYPSASARRLVELALRRDWDTAYVDEGPLDLLTCRRWDEDDPSAPCETILLVGPGMEFAAIEELGALDPGICARWAAVGAGSIPIMVVGMELGTFLRHNPPDPGRVGVEIERVLRESVLDPKVEFPGILEVERGHTYAARLLGPGRTLGMSRSRGYWYEAFVTITVNPQISLNGFEENLTLSITDIREIRAPDTLDTLPEGLIASGKTLELYARGADFGRLSRDGKRISEWQRLLATRIAAAVGGDVRGGGPY